jgi:peroxiredoxin
MGLLIAAVAMPLAQAAGSSAVSTAKQATAKRIAAAEVGKPAPDFALKDLDGKEHKLSAYKGKAVVLEWTNHQCPFVVRHQAMQKTMQKTYDRYKDKDVVWLAIDSSHFCEKEKAAIRAFTKANKVPFPILLDASGQIGRLYGAKTTPHMFVVDQKGVLVYAGAIDDDRGGIKGKKAKNYVAAALDSIVQNQPVQKSKTDAYGCSVKYQKPKTRAQ